MPLLRLRDPYFNYFYRVLRTSLGRMLSTTHHTLISDARRLADRSNGVDNEPHGSRERPRPR